VTRYEIEPRTTWIVYSIDDRGFRMTHSVYQTEQQAREMVTQIEDQARQRAERDARARAQKGKWTPESLRAAMSGPNWEIIDEALDYHNAEYRGQYRCVWSELDDRQPYGADGRPNYDVYGQQWVVRCHDQPANNGEQFTLSDPRSQRQPWVYLTADRLAAALIKRGLLEVQS
jgi:hypothetical protein